MVVGRKQYVESDACADGAKCLSRTSTDLFFASMTMCVTKQNVLVLHNMPFRTSWFKKAPVSLFGSRGQRYFRLCIV